MEAAVVVDNGSDSIKAGFSGDDVPACIFPTLISKSHTCTFIGDNVLCEKNLIHSTSTVIDKGIITNWNNMEDIWNYIFTDKLGINVHERNVFLSDSPVNTIENREKMIEIMMETFQSPATYIDNTSSLSLYASGRVTGLVIDSGQRKTNIVPIYQGFTIKKAIQSMDIGGEDLTDYLITLFGKKGYSFASARERYLFKDKALLSYDYKYARDIKEKLGEVISNDKNNNRKEVYYELPDNQVIIVGNERYQCTEPLFQPSLIGSESNNIIDTIKESITKVARDIQQPFYSNIVLSGGNSAFPGLSERIKTELTNISSPLSRIKLRFSLEGERKYYPWMGGAIITSIPSFDIMWITKEEYNEYGNSIIFKKGV